MEYGQRRTAATVTSSTLPSGIQYLVYAAEPTLTGSRVLESAGSPIALSDTGSAIQINVDISALSEDTSPDLANDFVLTYDASAADHKIARPTALSATRLRYANTSIPSGNTIANTASETAFASTYDIPANALQVGDVVRVRLWGIYGTALVAPTLRGRLKIDGATVLDTGTLTTVVGSLMDRGWWGVADFVVTAIGASGSLEMQGFVSFSTAASAALAVHLANTAAITVDTTQALTLSTTIEWGTASASNTMKLRTMLVEHLRAT